MKEKSYAGYYFLIAVVVVYAVVGMLQPQVLVPSLLFSLGIVEKIIPVFIMVFGLMAVVNYYATPKVVAKHFSKAAGIKRWALAVLGGTISTGPIYMWYPMLRELKERGVNYGFIATFLYNRAIKPPLIPVIIYYFGIKFTVVLTGMMILFSILQGLIIEKIEEGGVL